MDYRETVNLPQTDFPMRAGLARKEPAYQAQWDEQRLYHRIREARAGEPMYILHDGPPYPTGDLHIGTGLNKILKDMVVRYQTLRGRNAPYVPGWDCHGLPIEHQVMQQLGERAKTMAPAEVRARCERHALRFVDVQRDQFKRLGVSGEWERPYLTLHPEYEAGVLDVFRRLVARGFVTRSLKTTHWCMNCRTVLAEAEIEYGDEPSPSIFVNYELTETPRALFPGLAEDETTHVLIWTTTPWTLPANRAIAVAPGALYAAVRYTDSKTGARRTTVLADDLVDKVMEAVGAADVETVGTCRGKELEGLKYRHRILDLECPVVLALYVSLDDGTGCVHTAPGHGAEDYGTGVKYGLEIACPVAEDGSLTDEAGLCVGKSIWDANPEIVEQLDAWGVLVHASDFRHSYPHCWRCHAPVIFRATRQWFVQVDHNNLRERALEWVGKVRWVPASGERRISAMIEERPDWCISRQRLWGVPIPALYCDACGEAVLNEELVTKVMTVFREKGAGSWFTEDVSVFVPKGLACPKCGAAEWRRETDIFDVWFESGSSHRAVCEERAELDFPADLYLEGSDQHRGWFQLSLLPSVGGQDVAPFRTVLTHGFVVDERGEKMSKSKGNYISVADALKKFPADILRLWVSMTDFRADINVSYDLIQRTADFYRRIRNTFKYLVGNLYDFDPAKDAVAVDEMLPIDRWALARLHELIEQTTRAMENFEFHRAYHQIHHFCSVDMSSFYLDVLKDRMYCEGAKSLARRSGQTAMRAVLLALVRLVAPVLVHTAEEVWGYVTDRDEDVDSVHLAHWPEAPEAWADAELLETWRRVGAVRSDVLRETEKLRKDKVIGSSQEATVKLAAEGDLFAFLKSFADQWPTILISSDVELIEGAMEGVAGTDCPGLTVQVSRTDHPKCARCWNHLATVSESKDHPELCARCVGVVEGP